MFNIQILTTNGILSETATIDFTLTEMPYGAKGYRFNGSSQADSEELNKYWKFVDQLFEKHNISTTDYITLITIT